VSGNHAVPRGFLPAAGLTLVLLCTPSAPAAAGQDLARVDEFVRTEMARQQIPGVAVAIIRNGTPVKVQGYGLANVEHQVPVTPETIFQSGSVGKQFTAAAVMTLVEEGKLSPSDSLTRFFPDAPRAWKRITVRHLLTHTSGLPDYTAGMIDYRRDYTEDELQQFAYGLKLEFEPGARWNYSNTGYVLLGIIIHKVSGQFYGDLLRERIFVPLGMKTARIITEEDIVSHRADGYRLVKGVLKHQEWVAPRLNTTADGSLYLSLQDMIAWDTGLREGRVLTKESWEQVFTPVALLSGKVYPYGFGWNVGQASGHRAQRHGGSWQGFKSYIARYPDDGLTVIVLANLAEANPEQLNDGIASLIVPTLAAAGLEPIVETDKTMQVRVRRLIEQATAGKLTRAEFAYVPAGFFPGAVKAYVEALRGAGPVTTLTLLQFREIGDDRVYTYDVAFADRTLRLFVSVAPDGKLAAFDLRPRQP
jgi:CubicO group peptidase (beta-lactamase class C family)